MTEIVGKALAAGIFVVENLNHLAGFAGEVKSLVIPAIHPIPAQAAFLLHALTISLGLAGSTAFIFSDSKSSRFRTGARLLAIFMIIITWNWWFRRFGTFVWQVEDLAERRMRTIHCLKNMSIFGFLLLFSGKNVSLTKLKK